MHKFYFRNRKISFILSLVLLFSIFTCYSVSATTVEEYKDKIAEYEEKIDEAQGKIDALEGDINQVQAYIEELDKQIAMYQEQIDAYNGQIGEYQDTIDDYEAQNDALEARIDELNDQIDECNDQIEEMNSQIDSKYEELKGLIRTNYINGETSAIEVLLCSDDFSDYLTKVQFVSSLADYEQGLINGINDDIAKVDATLKQIDEDKETIKEIQADIDAKIKEIEILQDAVEANKSKVQENQDIIQAKVDENSNYLASLNDQSAEYEAMIDEYEEAIAQFDRQIQSMLQSNGSSGDGRPSSSGLICPLQYSGAYVSSPFYRNSDGSYHGALDLCVYGGSYGKNISAAASGKVITASYHWSYGNYLVIDHGNGLSTLYAHCSSLAVSSGQSVTQGQTVAYVGSTGNSTGPHLHFEVRINGSRVNPAGYISV